MQRRKTGKWQSTWRLDRITLWNCCQTRSNCVHWIVTTVRRPRPPRDKRARKKSPWSRALSYLGAFVVLVACAVGWHMDRHVLNPRTRASPVVSNWDGTYTFEPSQGVLTPSSVEEISAFFQANPAAKVKVVVRTTPNSALQPRTGLGCRRCWIVRHSVPVYRRLGAVLVRGCFVEKCRTGC